jgi:HEAT repeat protein
MALASGWFVDTLRRLVDRASGGPMRTLPLFLILLGFVASAQAQPARQSPAARAPRVRPGKFDLAKASAALVGADLAAATKAATELGAQLDLAAHEPLLDAFATGVHPDVMIAGLTALTATASKTDLAAISIYTRFRNPAVRAAALRAFSASIGVPEIIIDGLGAFDASVRAAAADVAGRLAMKEAVPALLILLDKGEIPAAQALGSMADADLARVVADHLGTAPDNVIAIAMGAMLLRPGFGPEAVRVDSVRALLKLSGTEAVDALEGYVNASPATPPRQSRREAEAALKALQAGGR